MIKCLEELDAGRRAFPCTDNVLSGDTFFYNGSALSEDGRPVLDLYLSRYMKGTAKNFYAVCIGSGENGYYVQICPKRKTKHNIEIFAEELSYTDVLKLIENFTAGKLKKV